MMRNIIYTLILLLFSQAVFAQKDVEAKAILKEVSRKYKSYNVVKSDFTYVIESPQANDKETETGTIIARSKVNAFKVILYDHSAGKTSIVSQEIISDGKKQWTYLKKDNEVQLNNIGAGDDALNPANIFTLYEHGFSYLYMGDEKVNGKLFQVIELTPTDSKKSFFKIRLMIDKVKKQLYRAQIFDKNGNKYAYTVKSFVTGLKADKDTFVFDAKTHPGVEVVDLR